MTNETILQFENYTFQYNAQSKPTLYDISLEIHRGEKILIVGPSGCGKSTLVHCINGLIPFSYKGNSEGTLRLFGKETKDLSLFEISHAVGTVLQDSDAQFVGLTVAEDIAFALENDCVPTSELYDSVKQVAKIVDMEHKLNSAPGELSGGQKQRVSMAGILVDDVDIILFDEPLAALDPSTGKTAIELIDKIHADKNKTVIIVEHRLEDVLHRNVDRIILMNEGRIIADTTPDEILSTSLLVDAGIREPLYITALKYAGVDIKADMKPANINTLKLTEDDISKVNSWYTNTVNEKADSNKEVLLSVDNLSFSYGQEKKILNDINVKVMKEEMLAIVGTNGAGKSTFAKVVCGFETESEGAISLNGNNIAGMSIKERADHIGYVMQNPNQMISKVMIYDEVALGLRTRGVDEKAIEEKVADVLKICGLWPYRKWPVSALSYGQKKRVTIASILVLEPEVIILDEPTAGQDYRHYVEIMDFLIELNNRGITVIMITHDMHLMLEYADRAIVFSDGRIIADDAGYTILTTPEIVKEASLKETSLYELAVMCHINNPQMFVSKFIGYEKEARVE